MRKKNTEILADVIRQVLKEQRIEKPLYEHRVINAWPVVLGKNIMQYTSALNVKNGVLYVQITSAALRQDLHMSRSEIKKALNNHVGADIITEIVFR